MRDGETRLPLIVFIISFVLSSIVTIHRISNINVWACVGIECYLSDNVEALNNLLIFRYFFDETTSFILSGYVIFLPLILMVSILIWFVSKKLVVKRETV